MSVWEQTDGDRRHTEVGLADEAEEASAARDAGGATDHEPEGDAEGDERFWGAVREKVISWRSMRPSQRLITGIAVAQLLAAGAIIALHGIPAPQLALGSQSGHETQMTVPYFWASIIFLDISLSFLLTGALSMRWPMRLVALGAFSAMTLLPPAPTGYSAARIMVVAALWLWAGVVGLAEGDEAAADSAGGPLRSALRRIRRPLRSARKRLFDAHSISLPLVTLALVLLAQVALDVVLLASTGWTRDASDILFQLTIGTQMEALALLLAPFLFLAGSDFAELGELVGASVAQVTRQAGRSRRGWLTLTLTGALALIVAITLRPAWQSSVKNYALVYGGELIACGIVTLILVGLLRWGRATNWQPMRLTTLTLLVVTLGYFALTWLGIIFSLTALGGFHSTGIADFSVYHAPVGSPTFSMPYPSSWKVGPATPNGSATEVEFDGAAQIDAGQVYVVSYPNSGANAENAAQLLHQVLIESTPSGNSLLLGASGIDGPWRTQQFAFSDRSSHSAGIAGEGWSRAANGRDWAIVGLTAPTDRSTLFPAFAEMAHAWRPDLSAQTPTIAEADTSAATNRATILFLGLGPLLFGLLLGFWLVRRGGKHQRTWQAAGVYGATLGLVAGVAALPRLLELLGAPNAAVWFLGAGIDSIQQVAAIGALALVGYVALRRRSDADWIELVRLTLTLLIGLVFVGLMYRLYATAISLSRGSSTHPFSWAEALIVLIALGWDLLMSGEHFTNRDDSAMPRVSRLLLYLGYITLTATLVMFFAAQSYTYAGGPHDSFFESEPWPQMGVQVLGLPMIIAAFAVAVAAWIGRRRRRAPAGEPATSEEMATITAPD